MPKIIITAKNDGNVEIKTEGFKGEACKDATKSLKDRLGMVIADSDTSEMYESNDNTLTNGSF